MFTLANVQEQTEIWYSWRKELISGRFSEEFALGRCGLSKLVVLDIIYSISMRGELTIHIDHKLPGDTTE
jgi:hypothetical protein